MNSQIVDVVMDSLAEKLNTKLQEWQPNTVNQVRQLIVELPKLKFLNRDSFANVQDLRSISRVRLERQLVQLPDETMHQIKQAILIFPGFKA